MFDMELLTEKDVPGAELNKPPENATVKELGRWLECHGLKKGGMVPSNSKLRHILKLRLC